jgi:hypothetical protein
MSFRVKRFNTLTGPTERFWSKNRNNIYTTNNVSINKEDIEDNFSLDVSGSTKISGNLYVEGERTIIKTSVLEINDPLINIGKNNYSLDKPTGFYSQYNRNSDPSQEVLYTGLIKPSQSDRYALIDKEITNPDNLIGNVLPSSELSVKKLFIDNNNNTNDNISLDISGDIRISHTKNLYDNSCNVLVLSDDNIVYKQDFFTLNSNINNLYFINVNNHNLLEDINITNNIRIYYFPFSNGLIPIEEGNLSFNSLLSYGIIVPFDSLFKGGFGYLKIGDSGGNQNITIKIGISKLNYNSTTIISNISNILESFTEDIIVPLSISNGSDVIKFDIPNSNLFFNKGDLLFFKIIFYIGSYMISFPILNTTLILKPT